MRPLWRFPAAWLIAIPILVLALLALSGRLTAEYPPDSSGYTGFDWSTGPPRCFHPGLSIGGSERPAIAAGRSFGARCR